MSKEYTDKVIAFDDLIKTTKKKIKVRKSELKTEILEDDKKSIEKEIKR